MREFRFLDDKRKASGLSQVEEEHYQLLAAQLGVQPVPGYFATDGNWYPYPDQGYGGYPQQGGYYDPNAIDPNTGYPYQPQDYDPNYAAQGYYPPQGYDPNQVQYDEQGNPLAAQPAYDPNYAQYAQQQQWPQQQQQQYDPNAYAQPQAYPQPSYPPQQQYSPYPAPPPSGPQWSPAPHPATPALSAPPQQPTSPYGQPKPAPSFKAPTASPDGPAEIGDDEVMEVTDDDVQLLDTSAPMGSEKLNTRIATPRASSPTGLFGPGSRAILGAPVKPLPRAPAPAPATPLFGGSAAKVSPFASPKVPAAPASPFGAPAKPAPSSLLQAKDDGGDLLGDLKSALDFDLPSKPEPVKPASSLLSASPLTATTLPPGSPEDSIPMLDLEPEKSLRIPSPSGEGGRKPGEVWSQSPSPAPSLTATTLPPGSPEDSIPMMDLEPEASLRRPAPPPPAPEPPPPAPVPPPAPIVAAEPETEEISIDEEPEKTEPAGAAAAPPPPPEPEPAPEPPPPPSPAPEPVIAASEPHPPLGEAVSVAITESLPEIPETAKTQPSLPAVPSEEELAAEREATLPKFKVPPELLDQPLPNQEPPQPITEQVALDDEPSVEVSAEMTALPADEKTPLPRPVVAAAFAPPPGTPEEDLEITPAEWERSSAPPPVEQSSVLVSPDLYPAKPPPPPEPAGPSVLVSPELFTPPETPAVQAAGDGSDPHPPRPPPPPAPSEPSIFVSPELMSERDEIPAPRPSIPLDISVTEPEETSKPEPGLFGAQPVDLAEPEAVQQREKGADLFGPPLAQAEDAQVAREAPAASPLPKLGFVADATDVPVAPVSPPPPPPAVQHFTPSLQDLPPPEPRDFDVHVDDKPLPVEEPVELAGAADDKLELAGTADFIQYQQAPTDSPVLEAAADTEAFEVETGSLAEVANQQTLRPIAEPAPADLAPDMVPLASNADFLGSSELTGTGEAWQNTHTAMELDALTSPQLAVEPARVMPPPPPPMSPLPPPEPEGEVIQGDIIQGEIIQGEALDDEEALPLEAEVVETELAPPASAPAPIPLLAQAAPAPRAVSPFSAVAIPPPEPTLMPAPPRPVAAPKPVVQAGPPQLAPAAQAAGAPPTAQPFAQVLPNFLQSAPPAAPAPVAPPPPAAPHLAGPASGNSQRAASELFDRSGASFGETSAIKIAGEHRVILHTLEGQVKRGVLRDADLSAELIALELSPGSVEKLSRTRVKALFFMLAPGEKPKQGQGDKLRVTFKDGRQVSGFSTDYKGSSVGFFVVPADSRTNTARIFIFRSAVDVVALD